MEPTEEQIRKLWEKCGFRYTDLYIIYPDNSPRGIEPPIDLNHLWEYAMPKFGDDLCQIILQPDSDNSWYCGVVIENKLHILQEGQGDTPDLALFWACYKALGLDK